jgi:hypothetical protein
MLRSRRALGLATLGTVAAIACGAPRLPAPDYTGQPTTALVEVPYPPPPARVEAVPEPPSERAVWIDGEWIWKRRWSWKAGRWVVPPPGARYAPWTTVRDRTGTLYFAAGTWRDERGADVAEPPPVGAGNAAPVTVVDPEGETVSQGPPGAPLDAGAKSDPDAEAARALEALDVPILDAGGDAR